MESKEKLKKIREVLFDMAWRIYFKDKNAFVKYNIQNNDDMYRYVDNIVGVGTIQKDIDRLEKQDKAIEILKRTCISQRRIMFTKNYEEFESHICYDYERVLTKEEYDIIKEVFGDDK